MYCGRANVFYLGGHNPAQFGSHSAAAKRPLPPRPTYTLHHPPTCGICHYTEMGTVAEPLSPGFWSCKPLESTTFSRQISTTAVQRQTGHSDTVRRCRQARRLLGGQRDGQASQWSSLQPQTTCRCHHGADGDHVACTGAAEMRLERAGSGGQQACTRHRPPQPPPRTDADADEGGDGASAAGEKGRDAHVVNHHPNDHRNRVQHCRQ